VTSRAPTRAVPALASGPPARAPRAAALLEAASPDATHRPEADTLLTLPAPCTSLLRAVRISPSA
jgi:hypothetical protein